jgi:Ca2+-binding EF-hand superfamily protein
LHVPVWFSKAKGNCNQTLDENGAGYIMPDKLREFLTTKGEPFTKEEADEMINACADPVEGKIFYADIVSTFCA